MSAVDISEAITRAHHQEWARVVASLTRRFSDRDIAEERGGHLTAVECDSVLCSRRLVTTKEASTGSAARKARDKQKEAQRLYDDDPPEPVSASETSGSG